MVSHHQQAINFLSIEKYQVHPDTFCACKLFHVG